LREFNNIPDRSYKGKIVKPFFVKNNPLFLALNGEWSRVMFLKLFCI
jgi:hypothetical protein